MATFDFNGEEGNGQGIRESLFHSRNSTLSLVFINYCKEIHELQ
jgi:hypothetical protein